MKVLQLCLCGVGAILALFPSFSADTAPLEGGLDWQLGTWEGTRRAASDGSVEPMQMTVASILDGAGQTHEMEIPHADGVYRGFAVQVFDPEREVWLRRYVNDVRRTFASYEWKVTGPGSVWRSVTPGRTRESRLVSRHPAPDRWIRTLATSADDGASWTEVWVDELVRKQR